jgi:uncharacterized protein (DUF952 family)
MIVHLTSFTEWQAAQSAGAYIAPSLAGEGFIHCSTEHQIVRVANAFYTGKMGLILLVIDPARLTAPMQWDDPAHPAASAPSSISNAEKFPHIYGAINLDAVIKIVTFEPDPDGSFSLPSALTTNDNR